MAQKSGRTTIQVSRATHARLSETKPFESMSYDEWVRTIVDDYEGKEGNSRD